MKYVTSVIPLLLCLCSFSGCTQLEPRWLLRSLPGEYPDVVYFFPTRQKLIALTIDDGPDPGVTGPLLDLLARHDAHATFFFVSDNIAGNESLVTRAVAEGHELGNHMTRDEVSANLDPATFDARLQHAHRVLSEYGPVRWFRPGSGWYNDDMLVSIRKHGYRLAEASMAPLDARLAWPAAVATYIRYSIEPGSIIVLHTRKSRGPRTIATLERVLPNLSKRGFRLVTLTELANAIQSERKEPDEELQTSAQPPVADRPAPLNTVELGRRVGM